MGNDHFIEKFLQVVKNFWVVFGKFCKSIAVALACSFFTPYEVNVTNILMMQCSNSFPVLLFEKESNCFLCPTLKLCVDRTK